MPTERLYPGVYVEEVTAGARPIQGVPTSITAFVGRTAGGPSDAPTLVTSFERFEHTYRGTSPPGPLSHAVRLFFENGGTHALIARIVHRDATGHVDESAPITDEDLVAPDLEPRRRGLWLLDHVDLFNLLCIPPFHHGVDVGKTTWNTAIRYAARRRAFVIVDAPAAWTSTRDVLGGLPGHVERDRNAAIYFPRLLAIDPQDAGAAAPCAPCGAIAGVYARTDAQHGVWKAPAGVDATLRGAIGLVPTLTDFDSGQLNPQGVNTLRAFPIHGNVVWGARTLDGADDRASEWKYVPVRRLALFIEESVYRGTQWVLLEPNGEALWSQLRLNVGEFMHDLFRQGAFQGTTPREAYFVKCDRETTRQADVEQGRVHLHVGFAPLKPAEFVALRIELRADGPEA